MKSILVINAGSSSLKYQLIDIETEEVLAKGLCERIGIDGKLTYKPTNGEKLEKDAAMPTHQDAIALVLDVLVDPKIGVISDMKSIAAVGHRVVHGGTKFTKSVLIDDEVIKMIEECIPLAPLHNPANLMGINACRAVMPDTPMVAVFDTAWGMSMEPKNFLYALPYEIYEQYQVRRYGFHGTSHMFVTGEAIKRMDRVGDPNVRVITCHLGNGSSVSCSKGGKCVNTSMGLTPLEGLPMGTRCGSIDPAIVPFLVNRMGATPKEIDTMMNKKSGMLGVSGVSSDFRDLWSAKKEGNERAALALDMFSQSVKRLIGAYSAEMDGVDCIVFTAGVGENDAATRDLVMQNMDYLGVDFDFELNGTAPRGKEVVLSKPDSKVVVMVLPTNEELAIARDTAAIAL
ncbi:MAG: acetate kinase [Clostridia bacterium]|jgi:acetate kinase|nr:acetate kinase [Clostridia bacterium]MBR2645401.1 acetate kinase [Clostridia bacterium]MBR3038759.1 acetate kinase [Clostridia bacterium]